MLIGHRKIVQFFDNAALNGVLGHAYCLVGTDGVGKRAVADYLAAKLMNTTPDKLTTHPDYYYLARCLDEKTEKLHKDITVKQARELRERLRNRSWLGGYQVIIVDEAELLNDEAANALLKVLEEPPKQSVFFLLTTDERAVLPTIRSRCQLVYFSLVSTEEIKTGLIAEGCDSEVAQTVARLAWGRPGRAVAMWKNEDERQNYYSELQRLSAMVAAPFYVKIAQAEELFGKKDDDTQMKRGRWQDVLKIWQMVWRDALLYKLSAGGGESGESDLTKFSIFPTDKILKIIDKLKAAEKLMGENINPRLLIEEAILEF